MDLTPQQRARLVAGLADIDQAREGLESVKLTLPVPGMFGGSPAAARLFAAVAQAHEALERDLAETTEFLDQVWEEGYALIRDHPDESAPGMSGAAETEPPSA